MEKNTNFKIVIEQDSEADSPRSYCNLGTMVCWHKRYILGDEQPKEDPEEWEKKNLKDCIYWPLYLFDHSGITMRPYPFSCPWDSGQVGWIYVTNEKAKKEYGWEKLSPEREDKVRQYLKHEVELYDHFLTGSCWGYRILEDGEEVDSCWGFYGDTLEYTGIPEHIDKELHGRLEEAWEKR